MDQTIMIFAGDFIDSKLGVSFGLATMQAAAMGQLMSDTSGVMFGNTLESWVARLGLPYPDATSNQRRHWRFRVFTTAGAAFGVALGCAIDFLNFVFFIDAHKADR